jgi:hypothetical protein
MKVVILTRKEFDGLKALQVRMRWDWPAVFSTNCRGDIWPFARYGYTPDADRLEVRGLSRVIDEVADIFVKVRSDGGRFFIGDSGAVYRDEAGCYKAFVQFQIAPES